MALISDLAQQVADQCYSALPQKTPNFESLQQAKIIAHRGVHEGGLQENSLEALKKAVELKLYGVEFDLRWTQDEVPILCHDSDLGRLYPQAKFPLSEMSSKKIRSEFKEVTSLEEVLNELRGQIHFFIEIKEPLGTMKKKEILQNLLDQLAPIEDFHLMSLDPKYFDTIDFVPPQCLLPIAQWKIQGLSQLALERGWGGLTGHYLRLSPEMIHSHHEVKQLCGTGFINSKNLFFRELNRKVDWAFTDRPMTLLKSLKEY